MSNGVPDEEFYEDELKAGFRNFDADKNKDILRKQIQEISYMLILVTRGIQTIEDPLKGIVLTEYCNRMATLLIEVNKSLRGN